VNDLLKPHLSENAFAFVQHVKADTVSYIELLIEAGAGVPFVVAIPYSTEPRARETFKAMGIKVLEPGLTDIERSALTEIGASGALSKRLFVQEVGGYLANASLRECRVAGIVEETKGGLWRYQAVAERLITPTVEVADTDMKAIEAHFVGEAVCDAVARRVMRYHHTLRYMRVGLFGYGDIGSGVAEALLRRRITPLVYDIDEIKLCDALTAGCRIGSAQRILSECDIVIGATGRPCFSVTQLKGLARPQLFASASSRDIEFPIAEIESTYRLDREIRNADLILHSKGEERFVFLGCGYPINFGEISLPPNISDLLFLLVSAALLQHSLGKTQPGLQKLDREFERIAAKYWLEHHPAAI
jgi:S-adenosylhomocysteine hydrolase